MEVVRLHSGQAQAASVRNAPTFPNRYTDKHVLAVTIDNAYLDGAYDLVPYSSCEVYAPLGIKTNVCMYVRRFK